jgi:hypothetical protein
VISTGSNNITPEQLLQMAKLLQESGADSEQQKEKMLEFAKSGMNQKQAEKLEKILSDSDAVNKLMESKAAQMLLKNLFNKKP